MIKLVIGSLLFVAGIAFTFTIAGAIFGVPMAIAGFGMSMAGYASLATSTVKGGVAAARLLNSQSRA
ncbi:MAG TPA: hypothetical protein VGN82_17070 [Bosea sp. (in: a-proteobacteria)]|jgi:type IV secretory pathway VirB3-like protein|uniref:hypothetical protein n=1 Tax=Bosea sp. (in: a-proteobacteria) TaxID=1871050 RepID=UPI002E0EC502|nr:hypothetical protein [Bosea sp. (in: a-proteobacteria)]